MGRRYRGIPVRRHVGAAVHAARVRCARPEISLDYDWHLGDRIHV